MRIKSLFFASVVLCALNLPAAALSWTTQIGCAGSYLAYCSQHTPGSAESHACMSANRAMSSNLCATALTDDGILRRRAPRGRRRSSLQPGSRKRSRARPPRALLQRSAAKPVAKAPPEEAAATKPTPEAAPAPAPWPRHLGDCRTRAGAAAHAPPRLSSASDTSAAPRGGTESGIDQGTFEAFKSRAPYFVPTPETLMLEGTETAANASVPPPSVPR